MQGCRNREALIGHKFGDKKQLEVIAFSHVKRQSHWKVKCNDCSNTYVIIRSSITGKKPISKCQKCFLNKLHKSRRVCLLGKKFGRLTVIEYLGQDKNRVGTWLCQCECGELRVLLSTPLTTGHTKSCGCYHRESTSNRFRGSKHHFWNPELTKEDRKRKNKEYSDFRNAVFVRDDYTCQCCKVRGGKLQAHHLDGFHWCKEKRTDVGNGITLCVNCHSEFHETYGTRNNTKQQFRKFLKSKGKGNE